MKRIGLCLAILALLTAAHAQPAPDADGDGIADEIEWRLGSDPERAEPLEVICDAPGTVLDGAPARLDLDVVRFGNVAEDRWLFALDFADDFTFENCYVLMYLDADNDPATGRPGFGNDYYWTFGGEDAVHGTRYTHRGERVESPDPRMVIDGPTMYVCGEAPILQQDGRSRFRLNIAVETRDPRRKTDAISFAPCEGPPNSDRQPAGGVATVRGVVIGPRDEPVSGANVRIFGADRDGSGDPFEPAAEATTDAEGRFELQAPGGRYLPSATSGTLVLSAQRGRVPEPWQLVAGVLTTDRELRMTEGASVTGTVVGPDGQPVADAQIASDLGYTGAAGEDGRFTIEAIPDGERMLLARVEGLVGTASPLLATGVTRPVEIPMTPSVTVRGTVTSEASGEPVEGAVVRLKSETDRGLLASAAMARTDARGEYAIAGVPADWITGEVTISHDDFPDQVHAFIAEPGETEIVADFALHTGYAVEGRVLLPDGAPAEGTLMRLGPYRGFDAAGARQTDAEGRFHIGGLPDSYQQVLVTELEGYAPAATLVRPGRGDDVPHVELTLRPGHEIIGRLLTPSGDPLQHEGIQAMVVVDGHATEVGHFVRTDDEGWWAYPDLPAEGAFLRWWFGGGVFLEVPITLDGENYYQKPQAGFVIGRVLSASGEPVSQFEMTVLPPEETGDEAGMRISEHFAWSRPFADPGGNFEMEQMPVGLPLRLQVMANGYEMATVGPIEAGPRNDPRWPLTIELTPAGG